MLPRNRYLRPKQGSAGAAVSRGGGAVGGGGRDVGVHTPTTGLGMGRALLRELRSLGSSCSVTLGKSLAVSGPHLPALHNEGRTW